MKASLLTPVRWARHGRLLWTSLLVFGMLSSFRPRTAHAYAWMIRHGYSACSTCHVDPSGGELLTLYGRVTAQLLLNSQYGSSKEEAQKSEDTSDNTRESTGPRTGMLWGAIDLPDFLLLSGSYRNLLVVRPSNDRPVTFVPVMQADMYGQVHFGIFSMGGSVGIAKVPAGALHARAAQVTTGGDDKLNLISRTHYLGLALGDDWLLRAGRLNLPFGVRVPEHTLWAREATRTDRESDQEHGIALAYVGQSIRGEAMAILGNYQTALSPSGPYRSLSPDAVRERGYSLFVEDLVHRTLGLGVSSKVTYARLDRLTAEQRSVRQAHGIMARYGPTEYLSVLAEADVLLRSHASAGYVGFVQADYEPWRGLHLLWTGELLDQGNYRGSNQARVQPGVGQPKLGTWVSLDWFFYKQFEFRTDVIFRQTESPTILGQVHMYL